MKISTKGRYGTRILLELAYHWGKGPVQLRQIAQNQQLPLNYIEHLIGRLVSAGLVLTTRGAGGGIQLAKHPSTIRVNQVIDLFEGSSAPVECVDNPRTCTRSEACVTHDLWSDVKKAVDGVLASVTIEDLAEKQKLKTGAGEQMYQI